MPVVLVGLQVALPQDYGRIGSDDPMERPWTTAFFKQPVHQLAYVSHMGVDGDGVADLKNHGGHDKAVLAYSADHYPLWRAELNEPAMGPGGFGENFTFAGCDEASVCIGDRWRLGEIEVEVSQPRQPCWKLARRWRRKDLTAHVIDNGRSGWYARVLITGHVTSGQIATLLDRPLPEWTVARANHALYHDKYNLAVAEQLAACPLLSESWREEFAARLNRTR